MRATIRLYAESYERDPSGHDQEPQVQDQSCALGTVRLPLQSVPHGPLMKKTLITLMGSKLCVTPNKCNAFIEVFEAEELFCRSMIISGQGFPNNLSFFNVLQLKLGTDKERCIVCIKKS